VLDKRIGIVNDLDVTNVLNVSNTTNPGDNTMRKTLTILTLAALIALPIAAGSNAEKDIVDTAAGTGTFNTLVAAVQAAGLVDALKADGPFTVFAPTDEAFAKLPAGTVDNLLKPENIDQLRAILTYHVVSGKVMASQVTDGLSAATLNGQNLDFAVNKGGVSVSGAGIVATDVGASNGVIHVIDTVLIPAG
jgi:uncharacterized surface protein with fasciclin (FAS1) repeats